MKLKAPWRAIRYSAPRCHQPFSIIPTSLTRWLTRSACGSARVRRIASDLRASPAKRLRLRPIWSTPPAAICRASPFTIPRRRRCCRRCLNFKGYVALQAWRVSNWLWRQRRNDLALLLQSLSSDQLQVSIHPSASIGTSVFLDHATGIIIGAFAVIGDEVTILQNVTIGRKQSEPDRAPKIGRGVYLSAGSTIIGDISIGDFAKIGAGAVVEHDVPAGCTAVGVPARLTNCPEPRAA